MEYYFHSISLLTPPTTKRLIVVNYRLVHQTIRLISHIDNYGVPNFKTLHLSLMSPMVLLNGIHSECFVLGLQEYTDPKQQAASCISPFKFQNFICKRKRQPDTQETLVILKKIIINNQYRGG